MFNRELKSHHTPAPNGRNFEGYGYTKLDGERPTPLFYPGIFADAAITLVVVCGLVVVILAVTP